MVRSTVSEALQQSPPITSPQAHRCSQHPRIEGKRNEGARGHEVHLLTATFLLRDVVKLQASTQTSTQLFSSIRGATSTYSLYNGALGGGERTRGCVIEAHPEGPNFEVKGLVHCRMSTVIDTMECSLSCGLHLIRGLKSTDHCAMMAPAG